MPKTKIKLQWTRRKPMIPSYEQTITISGNLRTSIETEKSKDE